MKTKILICLAAFSCSTSNFADTVAAGNTNSLKLFPNVRVSMQRMLKSSDERYFLSLYAGIWNPHATLYDLTEQQKIPLKGLQKGDHINLKTVEAAAGEPLNMQYELDGVLNANTGNMQASLTDARENEQHNVQFEPAVKVRNKPNYIFKFYGIEDADQPYGKAIKRVDVLDKTSNAVVQSLSGFTAFANSMGYMDINFDGYYDVILSDTSQQRKVQDKRYIYWMFNPKTLQYQRSAQLENIVGFPNLHGEKQQIDFGDGKLYQVQNGLLYPLQ